MDLRPLITAGVLIASTQVVSACGDVADRDLCTQFTDLVTSAEQMQQQDPLTAKAEDLRGASEEFASELDQLQAVSEGRLDTAVSALRASIAAVRQAAIEERADALEAARGQLEEAMDDLSEAWAVLEQRVAVQCDVD